MNKIERCWREHTERQESLLEFENWFDTCSSLEEARSNGFIDFAHRCFTPDFYKYVGDPKTKNCLEIGFGGGRLINVADKFFNKAYGLDVLSDAAMSMTQSFIDLSGDNDVTLLHYTDSDKIADKSIHFVYSFIVFQHFASYSVIENYLDIIKRVLTDDGCGVIYFGRNDFTNDKILEKPENDFVDRECSLYVKPDFMVEEMSKKFDVISNGIPTKKMWTNNPSMQFFIKFKNKRD